MVSAVHAAPPVDPITRRAVPVDGTIAITDFGFRDWGPEPVHYRINGNDFAGGFLSVVDDAGTVVPSQVDNRVLTFMARVDKGRTASYSVTASRRASESTLKLSAGEGYIEIRNEHIAVRLPAPAEQVYPMGVSAAAVQGPLLSWAPRAKKFIGHSRFLTGRKVLATNFRIIHQGPALFEYEARYRFQPEGTYVLRLRLSPAMPLAVISEEFDFNTLGNGEDLLLLDLHRGWHPAQVSILFGSGEKPLPKPHTSGFGEYIAAKTGVPEREPPVGGVGQAPLPRKPEEGAVLLEKIVPGGKWGGYAGGIQVSGAAAETAVNIGLVPLHVGSWRRTLSLNAWYTKATGISVALPISVRRMRWSLDIADDYSPFSTHEHDPGLNDTYGRRVWGLYSGDDFELGQARFGYVGLDRYKDWIVDTPEEGARYPGVFFSPDHIQRLKVGMDEHPDKEDLRNWYLFSGKEADAVRHAEAVIAGLNSAFGHADFFHAGLSHYRQSQRYAIVLLAEDALASRRLPMGLRRDLRRLLALYANLLSEPDFNPRGSGVHLGNNNMTINRTLALTYFAGLLHDHPRHPFWMDRIRRYVQFKFATQTSPDGPWIAAPAYQLYSPTRTMNVTQNVLRNLGAHDFSNEGYLFATLRYLAYLTVPDPRFNNRRIIPGMGNSPNLLESIWGIGMAAVADRHPEQAAFLRQAYLAAKGNSGILTPNQRPWRVGEDVEGYLPFYLPHITPAAAPLTTEFFPAYGVIFRHHYGPGETTLLLRAGLNWSHWDTDALNTIVYAKGAPLSSGTAYQYLNSVATDNNGIYHNQVKVGRRDLQEVFGRVDGAVSDYGFGPGVDYAVAERFYPGELFHDDEKAMVWRRHVMFLKSTEQEGANYFVLRDTFPGGAQRKTWWNWLNLGDAGRITVDGEAFDNAAVPLNQNVGVDQMPVRHGQTLQMKTDYGALSWFWFSREREIRTRMTMDYPRQDGLGGTETKTIVEIAAAPGEDYFYVLYPATDTEPVPQAEKLEEGVLRIRNPESTDTVFVGDEPFDYQRGNIVFTGRSGAVRVFADKVVLAMTSGSGRIGYRNFIVAGHGPFERTVPLSALKPQTQRIDSGYEKKTKRVDLGRGVVVQGEAPFSAELNGDQISIHTEGRKRVIFVSQPEFIVRPQLFIDGQEWMASWTDYPASGWGDYDETWKIGISVPAGAHQLLLRDMEFPVSWDRQFTPEI